MEETKCIEREFVNAIGLEIKFHQSDKFDMVYHLTVYSPVLARNIADRIEKLIEPQSILGIAERKVDAGRDGIRYSVVSWSVIIPFSILTLELIEVLAKDKILCDELAILANTLRDHIFSFVNTAANAISCKRVTEEQVREVMLALSLPDVLKGEESEEEESHVEAA